jgi:methylase of polypeptide subunit release factors
VIPTVASNLSGHPRLRRGIVLARAWAFRLFLRHRLRRTALERVAGRPIVVLPGVFNPRLFRTGEMLARYAGCLSLPAGTRVLDFGSGSGVVSVFAAEPGVRVVAIDINPRAVACTRMNVLLHGLEHRVDVREGDLFAPVDGERFDFVFFNPPFFPGAPREPWEHAWRSDDVMPRFLAGLPSILFPGGRAVLALSTVAAGATEALSASGVRVRVLARRQLLTETLSIVEVVP